LISFNANSGKQIQLSALRPEPLSYSICGTLLCSLHAFATARYGNAFRIR